jgi:DNA-directed RNA polymerase specialized sigma24 family protein
VLHFSTKCSGLLMTISKEIAPQLPFLRRFARALSGSQASGDAYVVATLEALIEDPSSFPRNMSPRPALYHIFLKLWSSMSANMQPTIPQTERRAPEKSLSLLTPLSRQAFLLRTVEGFSVSEVAEILSRGESEVTTLLDTAAREITEQVATDVLIIEDEPLIALDLEAIVQDLGHRIVGVARTRKEAVSMIGEHRPSLILADIQLADGSSGLDAVNDILANDEAAVIFITAYPERFLTGDRPEPAFLLTKPFEPEAVKAAISQALFFDRKASRKAA